jgi:hypothetical protein
MEEEICGSGYHVLGRERGQGEIDDFKVGVHHDGRCSKGEVWTNPRD